MPGTVKRFGYWIATVVTVALAAFVVLSSNVGLAAARTEAAQRAAVLEALEAEVAARSEDDTTARGSVASAVTGVDPVRVTRDAEIIENLARTATTWESQADYDAARDAVVTECGVDPESGFLTAFLPRIPDVRDAGGNSYSVIDGQRLNCHFVSADPILRDFARDEYSYFAVVTATGSRSGASANFTLAILCTLDGDGAFVDVDGYTLQ